ncbi:hypothetical protein BD779DRAFT_1446184 [Infundibulicybe gibba]|nr:hypothetical protein BD779DRAFT_1446184 [Infundibulicybe gibba]
MSTRVAAQQTPSASSPAQGSPGVAHEQPGVHPSAVGSATQPTNGSSQQNLDGNEQSSELDAEGYPPQKHAGKVGYGPQYHQGADLGDKMTGVKEEIKGKLTRNQGLAQQGKERRTGILKQKELEQSSSPDTGPTKGTGPTSGPEDKRNGEQAATVAPEGTRDAEAQRQGGNAEGTKQID